MQRATSHRRCRENCTRLSKIKGFMKTKTQNNDVGGRTPLMDRGIVSFDKLIWFFDE